MIPRNSYINANGKPCELPLMLCMVIGLTVALPAVQAAEQVAEKEASWSVASENATALVEQTGEINEPAPGTPGEASENTRDDVLQEALETAKPLSPSRTATINNRKLVSDIEAQRKSISEIMKHEDAFSPKVGELYFSYATLLLQAANFEEARDAFATALHVQKVNNGIYALEQRPALKGLFETMFIQGKTEQFEEYLNRIIWIENQHKDYRDDFAFDLLVKAGNFYIDQYLARPISSETGREQLRKANRYLTFAIKRYGHASLEEKLMPYGELALVSLLERKIIARADRASAFDVSRARADFEQRNVMTASPTQYLNRGEFYLKKYLAKAQLEKAPEAIASALLQLGDINLLFERSKVAEQYYQLAWMQIQNLPADHELRYRIAKPVELPAFNYTQSRDFVPTKWATKLIPITFAVRENGKVAEIQPLQAQDDNFEYFPKARSAARKLTFRPAIIDGKSVKVDAVTHDVRIVLKTKRTENDQPASS